MKAITLLKIFDNRLYKYISDNPLEYQDLCNTFQLNWKHNSYPCNQGSGIRNGTDAKSLWTSYKTYDGINAIIKFEYRNYGPTNITNFKRLDERIVLTLSGLLMPRMQWSKKETYSNDDADVNGEFELDYGWCNMPKSYPEAIRILETIFNLYIDANNTVIKCFYHLNLSEIKTAREQVNDHNKNHVST